MTKKAGGWKMIVVMSCALEPMYVEDWEAVSMPEKLSVVAI